MPVIRTLKNNFEHRLNDTLIASILISWCIQNWEVFIYIFYSDSFIGVTPIENIKNLIAGNGWWNLLPFALGLTYTLFYEKLQNKILEFKQKDFLKNKKLKETNVVIKKYERLEQDLKKAEQTIENDLRTIKSLEEGIEKERRLKMEFFKDHKKDVEDLLALTQESHFLTNALVDGFLSESKNENLLFFQREYSKELSLLSSDKIRKINEGLIDEIDFKLSVVAGAIDIPNKLTDMSSYSKKRALELRSRLGLK